MMCGSTTVEVCSVVGGEICVADSMCKVLSMGLMAEEDFTIVFRSPNAQGMCARFVISRLNTFV
jgi:hypothetical protein